MAFGPLVKAENAETPIPVTPSLFTNSNKFSYRRCC
jgi:hypothetical protein